MADEVIRLEQGIIKVAKAYGTTEKAVRGILRAFGEQIKEHNKITQGIVKQLVLDEKLTKALRKRFQMTGKVNKSLKKLSLNQDEIITVIQKAIQTEQALSKAHQQAIIEDKKRTEAIKKQTIAQEKIVQARKLSIDKLKLELKLVGLTVAEVQREVKWNSLRKKVMEGNKIALIELNKRVKEHIKATANSTQVLHSQIRSFKELGFAMIGVNKKGVLATRNARNVGGAFSVLRSKLLLAAFAFSMVERTVIKLAKAQGKQVEAENKVGQAIIATGGAAGLTGNQIKQYAKDLQSVTTFGDETILSSSALLLTFKRIKSEAFLPAQKAILDVAAAMGTDLKSATIQIGKALNDPIKGLAALNRVGIQFSEIQKRKIQKALLATNNTLDAQKIIVEELNSQFGGMAEILAMSTLGSIDQMSNAFGDLSEVAGEKLAPNIIAVTQSMKRFFENVDPDFIKELLFVLTATAGAMMTFGGTMKTVTKLMKAQKEMIAMNVIMWNSLKMAMIKTGIFGMLVLLGYTVEKFIAWKFAIDDSAGSLDNAKFSLSAFRRELITIAGKEGFDGLVNKLNETIGLLEMEYNAAIMDAVEGGKSFADMTRDEMQAAVDKLNPALVKKIEYLERLLKNYEGLSRLTPEVQAKIAGLRDEFDKAAMTNQRQAVMAIKGIQNRKEAIIAIDNEIKALEVYRISYDMLLPEQQESINALNEQAYAHEVLMNKIRASNLEMQNEILILQTRKEAYNQFYTDMVAAADTYYTSVNSKKLNSEKLKLEAEKATIDASRKSDKQKKTEKEAIDKKILALEKKHHNNSLMIKGASLVADYFISEAKSRIATAASASLVMLKYASVPGGVLLAVQEMNMIRATAAVASAAAKGSLALGLAGLYAQKMEQGGLIGGQRHSQGGTMINAEQGEFVMSRSAVNTIGIETLNRMNEGGGGGSNITVNVSGNVMSQDFTENEVIPAIKEALRRGEELDHWHSHSGFGPPTWKV